MLSKGQHKPQHRLIIETYKEVYGQGELVRGNFRIIDARPELIGKIKIAIDGLSKTKIVRGNGNNRQVYRTRRPLGVVHNIVTHESTALTAGQNYSWPFEIRFPTESPMAQGDSWSPGDRSVPPTMSVSGYHGEAYVSYHVTAVIYKHQSEVLRDSAVKPIIFSPYTALSSVPTTIHMATKSCTAKSLLLLPENAGRDLTFKEKASSIFSSSKLPTSTFTLNVMYPTDLQAGAPFNITAKIEHDAAKSSAPQLPDVILENVTISLKQQNAIMAEGLFMRQTKSWESDYCFKHAWTELGAFKPAEGNAMILSTVLSPTVTPCFISHDIQMEYRLKVVATVRVADRTFHVEAEGGRAPLFVWPRFADRSDHEMSTAPPVRPYAGEVMAEASAPPVYQAPPTYQEAVVTPEPKTVKGT